MTPRPLSRTSTRAAPATIGTIRSTPGTRRRASASSIVSLRTVAPIEPGIPVVCTLPRLTFMDANPALKFPGDNAQALAQSGLAALHQKGARGKGVGEALVTAALEVGRQKGAQVAELQSGRGENRKAAHRLYERVGFRIRDSDVMRIVLETAID